MILTRIYTPWGVHGRLEDLQTLERPYLDNKKSIPEGVYQCKRVDSPKFGDTFEITSVPNRTHILFHSANHVHQLKGCVALGLSISLMANQMTLHSSRLAVDKFLNRLKDVDSFELEIREYRSGL